MTFRNNSPQQTQKTHYLPPDLWETNILRMSVHVRAYVGKVILPEAGIEGCVFCVWCVFQGEATL